MNCRRHHPLHIAAEPLVLLAEYLTIPKDGRPSRMYISEVGHLLRVASIYSQMVGFAAESSSERLCKLDSVALGGWRNSAEATIRSHESALVVRFITRSCALLPN